MKSPAQLAFIIALSALLAAGAGAQAEPALLSVSPEPRLHQPPRIGLNLGPWTSWGAEQLSRNLLKNPGFEGVVDRALVRAVDVAPGRFSDDQAWLGRPDGFWAGAEWVVLTGRAAGQRGRVIDSRRTGPQGLPVFIVEQCPSGLTEGDIIALTRINDQALPERWWLEETRLDQYRVNPDLRRPGSPGQRSLGLHPVGDRPVSLHYHLDTLGDRAGSLLPVRGHWRFSLWVHGAPDQAAEVRVSFRRHGQAPFFDRTVPVTTGWQPVALDFHAQDEGLATPLELMIEVRGGTVHLDDVWLGPTQPAGTVQRPAEQAFNPALIALLRQLQPGYLRDWQGQLGDRLDNRLAAPFARRTSRYRPGQAEYFYGLPEFLDLCDLIGARPWLVLPTTLDPGEAEQAGQWLAGQLAHYGFEEIVIEFGNENWNPLFRPAGIQDPHHHGQAADRLFQAIRAGAGDDPRLRTAINAQHANPQAALAVARASRQADLVGLAPYFLNRADQADHHRLHARLFEGDQGRLDQLIEALPSHQSAAVYEINLHTTRGDLDTEPRAALVESPAAGLALAWQLLANLERGIARQNVYRAVGFDTFLDDRSALTPLFGVARDLGPPATLRPTGKALALLNSAIDGDFHALNVPAGLDETLRGAAFRLADGWTVLLLNRDPNHHDVKLELTGEAISLGLPGSSLTRLDCRAAPMDGKFCSQDTIGHRPGGEMGRLTTP
ncbi:MAG: hypothetical protein ACXIUL_08990 [Wenzhouxiangella sp.]